MIQFKLQKVEADQVIILNTPAAADAVLALGELSLKDEAGAVAFRELIRDITGKRKTAYSAGVANVRTINLTALSLPATGSASIYSITTQLSNVTEFGVLRAERTYVVSSDTTATNDEVGAAFVQRINNDLDAGFTAAYDSGTNVLTLTAGSASYGELNVTNNFNIAVVDATPWVAPSGTTADALQYVPAAPALVSATANYTKYLIRYRKLIRHNAVSGLSVTKTANLIVFADSLGGSYAAYATALDDALAGTTATAGAYTGTPSI